MGVDIYTENPEEKYNISYLEALDMVYAAEQEAQSAYLAMHKLRMYLESLGGEDEDSS